MSYGPPTKTVQDVMNVVTRKFGDESGVQLTLADVVMWVNDAQTQINATNKVLRKKSTTSTVAAQKDYTFPALAIQKIESLHVGGIRIPNLPFSQAEATISRIDPQATLSERIPRYWYEWAQTFTLWPTPNEVVDIDLYYTTLPTPVTVATDLLSLPDDYFQTVCDYVLQQTYEMDEDWAAVSAKAAQVQAAVRERGEREREAQDMTNPSVVTVDDDFYGFPY